MEFDVTKNRRDNLAKLAQRYPSKVALAKVLGRTPQQIGGMLNGTKSFGSKVARELEKRLELPLGSLDMAEWNDKHEASPPENVDSGNKLTIPVLDVEQVDGIVEAPQQATFVEHLKVHRAWLYAQSVTTTTPQSLRILTSSSDAMSPTIQRGDIVIVDTHQDRLLTDGVYAIQLGTSFGFRRLQIRHDRISIISDNKQYETYTVPSEDDLSIIGRCIMVFNIKDL